MVEFEGPGSPMWVIIEAVGTAVEASGSVAEALELVIELLWSSTANQVFSKRP